MKVQLRRLWYGADATIGKLVLPDYECYTLERPWRNNEPKISCVPQGTYPMVLEHSAKFQRPLWELKDVPGRSEVKLHAANRASELEGCIAPGVHLGIMQSNTALAAVMTALAPIREPVAIEITGPMAPQPFGPV